MSLLHCKVINNAEQLDDIIIFVLFNADVMDEIIFNMKSSVCMNYQ